jgi:hypothetical protein
LRERPRNPNTTAIAVPNRNSDAGSGVAAGPAFVPPAVKSNVNAKFDAAAPNRDVEFRAKPSASYRRRDEWMNLLHGEHRDYRIVV